MPLLGARNAPCWGSRPAPWHRWAPGNEARAPHPQLAAVNPWQVKHGSWPVQRGRFSLESAGCLLHAKLARTKGGLVCYSYTAISKQNWQHWCAVRPGVCDRVCCKHLRRSTSETMKDLLQVDAVSTWILPQTERQAAGTWRVILTLQERSIVHKPNQKNKIRQWSVKPGKPQASLQALIPKLRTWHQPSSGRFDDLASLRENSRSEHGNSLYYRKRKQFEDNENAHKTAITLVPVVQSIHRLGPICMLNQKSNHLI